MRKGLLMMGAVSVLLSLTTILNAADDHGSIVIVFKDGHQQTFAMSEITSIDMKAPSAVVYRDGHKEKIPASEISRIEFQTSTLSSMAPGRNHFLGKWEVGDGSGHRFYITLEPDGDARKSIGSTHGTWTVVDNEARISWDDGWHDAIRKTGSSHEKRAFEPGRTFEDEPSNVTAARNTESKPI
ncbi:MAG TPA: hypothetical protein VMH04_14590 [Candidatus Solibacter sp.]|nr:hypothetical protein [Candidatus Solibacter sp.]